MALSLDQLNGLAVADFVDAVGDCFEFAPWVAEAAAAKRRFATVTALATR